eukprot:CAMPEP_0115727634 /NCGR_PEP_ID=MMETSP0272-20121206/82525_1 /TAXON_ID=71861 /ORGANISM="Scrippsiella trochoidea, Strain CCMP3099" /LENGTH=42 /DNA_ID= /DNA_START= /DNA_END= /DNA_ORIENTATION=
MIDSVAKAFGDKIKHRRVNEAVVFMRCIKNMVTHLFMRSTHL